MLTATGNVLFRHRNALFPVACLLLFLPGPDPFVDALDATWVGGLIALAGQLIRAATIGLKYVVRGGRNRQVYAEDLVTEGIYAHTRNPMYLGNILIAAGLAIVSNSWTVIAIAIPLSLFMYVSIVAAEEDYLTRRFGAAFKAYCQRVPRWLPRISGFGETLASMQFRWRRLLLKEYGTPFGWITVLALMTLYNFWLSHQWAERSKDIQSLRLILEITFVCWLAALLIKRSRRITAD
jgi:protein-S-isoprenylcysteine O-methyltransferase Ste14